MVLIIYRSLTVYGCFTAGFLSLLVFTIISWYADKSSCKSEDSNQPVALSRGIRIAVYLITAILAIASSLITTIDIDDNVEKGMTVVPVK